MKKTSLFFLSFLLLCRALAQPTPTPDKLWGKLFVDVQLTRALGDNKTFVDMVPQHSPPVILTRYQQLKKKDSASLRSFVLVNFYLPPTPAVAVGENLPLHQHLTQLWSGLTRKADKKIKYNSLLPLSNSYIVPGGRFREIYYWDSYFTMQGLAVSNRYDLIEDMLENFRFLINTYGHIPNGNRNYYLSRSQPPYFALMVQLLQQKEGSKAYQRYFTVMEKEYRWWMTGHEKLTAGKAFRRVVKLPGGAVLNRYYDDKKAPREESYAEDMHTAKQYTSKDGKVYTHLRAGAESGWDFSSRWFADTLHLTTIETTNIIPVDLNALLYQYEMILSQAAQVTGRQYLSTTYAQKAAQRKKALLRFCWDNQRRYFFDYDFTQQQTTGKWSLAGVLPLFCEVATPEQAKEIKLAVETKFLKAGGVVTTLYNTGQQWDAPNGWAPLQWVSVMGLLKYGYTDLANTIMSCWMAVNERVYKDTGKMMEKYNVQDTSLQSGGGEYPTQDGFGWTNGVYLAFYQLFKKGER
jgi:alpha,alpha-trehalase